MWQPESLPVRKNEVIAVAVKKRSPEQIAQAESLLSGRNIGRLLPLELDLAMALLVFTDTRVDKISGCAEILEGGYWRIFSPTRNWDDYGRVIGSVDLVTSSHNAGDIDEDDNSGSRYFSSHAYHGSTSFEDRDDIRISVGRTCAALLAMKVEYNSAWDQIRPEAENNAPASKIKL